MRLFTPLFTLIFVSVFFSEPAFAKSIETTLSEKVTVAAGDTVKLKNSEFSVLIGFNRGTECAVPGFNCGSGYEPPHLTFTSNCGSHKFCPFVAFSTTRDDKSAILSIEDEKSCEKSQSANCFYDFARQFKTDEGCMNLKSLYGRYYCLEVFKNSVRPENKTLCDQLPEAIYGLRWNCYYEYAVRYRDPSFCEKYSAKDLDGKERCFLEMAELLKDQSFCKKISESKNNSYKEQCLKLKK